MQLSIVIPLLNEAESIPELQEWIERVMETTGMLQRIATLTIVTVTALAAASCCCLF
jgi:hypothetical protein